MFCCRVELVIFRLAPAVPRIAPPKLHDHSNIKGWCLQNCIITETLCPKLHGSSKTEWHHQKCIVTRSLSCPLFPASTEMFQAGISRALQPSSLGSAPHSIDMQSTEATETSFAKASDAEQVISGGLTVLLPGQCVCFKRRKEAP